MIDIGERVSFHARQTPGAVALKAGPAEVTYAELDRRSNQLAHWLLAASGAAAQPTREHIVAVCLPRTPDLVAVLVAALKAGLAYVPMDDALPAQRRDFMVGDCGAALTVTADLLHEHEAAIDAQPLSPVRVAVRPQQMAYVIYTSGSTGVPKGVMVQRDQLACYLRWAAPAYLEITGGAPLYSPVNVDLSVTSLFVPLIAGRTVTLLPVENPPVTTLPAALADGSFSFVKATPAHLAILALSARRTGTGRLVIGGEALSYEQLRAWHDEAPATEIVNEYGPTETAVACCVHTTTAGHGGHGAVPIGSATPGTRLLVLDAGLRPVADGQPGELYIGGEQVTRGYLGRAGLTAQRYRPDPDQAGARVYRSGDLVRRRPDGELVYLGRIDDQVKVNGYRIELAEIEAVLCRQTAVAAAAAAVLGTGTGKRLVAFVVPASGTALQAPSVRAEAARMLPPYMIPTEVIIMSELPLTSGGKVDRSALAGSPNAEPAAAAEARLTQQVAATVSEVIGRPVEDYDTDIVALGGTSLQIALIIARLIRDHGISLPAESWLYEPTVNGFARVMQAYNEGGPEAAKQLHAHPAIDADLDPEIFDALGEGTARKDHHAAV